jgi:hypothetical protein
MANMMNERIKELAKQSIANVRFWNAENESYDVDHNELEKFAELIVLEMCNVLDKEQWNIGRDWICDDGTRIIPKVKEHFGVE